VRRLEMAVSRPPAGRLATEYLSCFWNKNRQIRSGGPTAGWETKAISSRCAVRPPPKSSLESRHESSPIRKPEAPPLKPTSPPRTRAPPARHPQRRRRDRGRFTAARSCRWGNSGTAAGRVITPVRLAERPHRRHTRCATETRSEPREKSPPNRIASRNQSSASIRSARFRSDSSPLRGNKTLNSTFQNSRHLARHVSQLDGCSAPVQRGSQ